MRPIANQESYLRAPLSHVLGAQANVRLLRALTQRSGPTGISELARETGITVRGARQALKLLTELGVVEQVGASERGQHVQLCRTWPLAEALVALFAAEMARVEIIWSKLRAACEQLDPPPLSVWVEGPVAVQTDGPEDTLTVVALVNLDQADRLWEPVSESLEAIEADCGVLFELRVITRADLAIMSDTQQEGLARTVVIMGIDPGALLRAAQGRPGSRSGGRGTQAEADQKLKARGEAIALALDNDPRIIGDALAWLEKRLANASVGEAHTLREWRRILLHGSRAQLKRVLTGNDERATRLRQTLPFRRPGARR